MTSPTTENDDEKDLSLTDEQPFDATDLLSKEQKRITLLDTAIAGIISEKITVDSEGKTKVTLSSKEIRDLSAAQKDLNEMRRKNAGFGE